MTAAEMIMERVIPLPGVSVRPTKKKVVIIGAGPAGLFCADRLAGHANVTIYEDGLPIEKRVCPDIGCKPNVATATLCTGVRSPDGNEHGANSRKIVPRMQRRDRIN